MCVCPHTTSPLCFRFTSALSKPFPRKKKSTNCLLHSLLVCVCMRVCQLSPQLVFYCLLLCVDPDETVCRSLLTTHYVYCRMLTFLFLRVFACTRKNGSYLIRYKFLHSCPFYEHLNSMLLFVSWWCDVSWVCNLSPLSVFHSSDHSYCFLW